jgi:Holliday junction resolvase
MRNDYITCKEQSYLCIENKPHRETILIGIDTEDIELLSQYRWYFHRKKGVPVYIATRSNGNDYKFLHRMVINTPIGMETDHINGNTFDNRKCNLRVVTTSQNGLSCRKLSRNTSGFRGVHFHKGTGKWESQIVINGKQEFLGLFEDRHLASVAYEDRRREVTQW